MFLLQETSWVYKIFGDWQMILGTILMSAIMVGMVPGI
jgi:hypothetical protein